MKSKGPIYTAKLGKEVAAFAVPHKNPDILVLPEHGRWTVLVAGQLKRAVRILDTKSEAIKIARKAASKKESRSIVIFDTKGDVEREINL